MNTGTNYADLFFLNVPKDVDTLENNVKEYPFSSLARFLLLYHYKKNNNVAFENFAKKTGVYINNPFWIQYQLSKINEGSFSNEHSFQSEIQNKNVEENIPVAAEVSELPADQQIMQIPASENEAINENERKNNSFEEEKQSKNSEENIPVAAEEQTMQIPISENEVINENERKNNFFEEEKHNENSKENIPGAAEEQTMQIPDNEVINENEGKNNFFEEEKHNENLEENMPVAAEEQTMQIPVSENEVINENDGMNNSFEEEKHNESLEENIPVVAKEQTMQIPVSENEIIDKNESKDNSYQEENIPTPSEEQIMQIPVSEIERKVEKENLNHFEDKTKISEIKEEELIAFEPLHTVDYFASQGIKISEEALENDHLGQQVKSFTAWLKSMKRIHPGQLPEQNEVIEKIIQANAEVSNQNANVLTEAMAEVLIKQNKKEKAMEMYQKLSLINPSKSAYFAAKIESLKII